MIGTEDKVAKNLLLENTCNNCKHGRNYGSSVCLETLTWKKVSESQIDNNSYLSFENVNYPDENTCEKWDEEDDLYNW